MTINDAREAVARGWCSDVNRGKVMDFELAESISWEVYCSAQQIKLSDEARETLEFYADESNYVPDENGVAPIMRDRGDTAKEALR